MKSIISTVICLSFAGGLTGCTTTSSSDSDSSTILDAVVSVSDAVTTVGGLFSNDDDDDTDNASSQQARGARNYNRVYNRNTGTFIYVNTNKPTPAYDTGYNKKKKRRY